MYWKLLSLSLCIFPSSSSVFIFLLFYLHHLVGGTETFSCYRIARNLRFGSLTSFRSYVILLLIYFLKYFSLDNYTHEIKKKKKSDTFFSSNVCFYYSLIVLLFWWVFCSAAAQVCRTGFNERASSKPVRNLV